MDIEGLGIILIISLLRCHSTDALSFIHLSISTDFQPKFLGLSTPQPTLCNVASSVSASVFVYVCVSVCLASISIYTYISLTSAYIHILYPYMKRAHFNRSWPV